MRFVLRTAVAEPPETVFPVFGEAAFVQSLAPRLMGLRVVRIGLALGDEIEVRFTGLGPRGPWVSRIVELERVQGSIWFTDRSIELPWPFSAFRHHHGFEATDGGTTLVDDVTFSVRPWLLAPFVYPVLRLSFAGRRHVYRRRFGAPQKSTPTIAARGG
jgi:ligand-binding SRPBCC domain-containing protein